MDVIARAKGASPDELTRAAKAAMQVFEAASMEPEEAASSMAALERWDIYGFEGTLSKRDSRAANVWLDAARAAEDACCASWDAERRRNTAVDLELLVDPETQLAGRETALRLLREAILGTFDHRDVSISTVSTLARRMTVQLADVWQERELVDDLTRAFSALETARRGMPAKQRAVLDAIDALKQATEMRH